MVEKEEKKWSLFCSVFFLFQTRISTNRERLKTRIVDRKFAFVGKVCVLEKWRRDNPEQQGHAIRLSRQLLFLPFRSVHAFRSHVRTTLSFNFSNDNLEGFTKISTIETILWHVISILGFIQRRSWIIEFILLYSRKSVVNRVENRELLKEEIMAKIDRFFLVSRVWNLRRRILFGI